MLYEPETNTVHASAQAFREAHPHTSYGALADEDERNAAGLFTLAEDRPAHNPLTHALVQGDIEQHDDAWVRRWLAVPLGLLEQRANLTAAVTNLRWQHETGGITVGGIVVGTTIDDQNRITSVVANAQTAGVASVDFKAASGWVTLTVAQVQAIAAAIALHVQACFSAERAHHEALASTPDDELLAYDVEAGWPSTPGIPV